MLALHVRLQPEASPGVRQQRAHRSVARANRLSQLLEARSAGLAPGEEKELASLLQVKLSYGLSPHLGEATRAQGNAELSSAGLLRRKKIYSILLLPADRQLRRTQVYRGARCVQGGAQRRVRRARTLLRARRCVPGTAGH